MLDSEIRAIVHREIRNTRRGLALGLFGLVFAGACCAAWTLSVFGPLLLRDGAAGVRASAVGLSQLEVKALLIATTVPMLWMLLATIFVVVYVRYLFYRVLTSILGSKQCPEERAQTGEHSEDEDACT
jgi:hypothetical protein